MLADSPDYSSSVLHLSDLDIGGNSTASDEEGGDIPAPAEAGGDIPAPAEAGPALPSTTPRQMGGGGSVTTRSTGKCRKHAPTSGYDVFNIKHMTSELPKV